MARSRTFYLPIWLLLIGAVLLAGAAVIRTQMIVPSRHEATVGAPAAVEALPSSVNGTGAAAPASDQQNQQSAAQEAPSQVMLEAKGAQRQPPAGDPCGSNSLEVCPDH